MTTPSGVLNNGIKKKKKWKNISNSGPPKLLRWSHALRSDQFRASLADLYVLHDFHGTNMYYFFLLFFNCLPCMNCLTFYLNIWGRAYANPVERKGIKAIFWRTEDRAKQQISNKGFGGQNILRQNSVFWRTKQLVGGLLSN